MSRVNIISAKNLCFEYKDAETGETTKVLKNVSIDIEKGEFLVILGHNGSGKSTFAKHLNAILTATSGSVTIDGIDAGDEKNLFEIRKRVGMVFQNPDNQMVANIVEDDVAFAPENLGVPRDEIRKRIDEALEAVNMSAFKKHAPHMLSGGQKQRVAIAGVLAMEPEILVLDEPTAMLDPIGRREIIETVKRLNKEKGMTVVLITHYMDEATDADRVIVIDDGEVKLCGKPVEVFPQVKKLKELGLDSPQGTELIYRLNKLGFDIDPYALKCEDCVDRILKTLGDFK